MNRKISAIAICWISIFLISSVAHAQDAGVQQADAPLFEDKLISAMFIPQVQAVLELDDAQKTVLKLQLTELKQTQQDLGIQLKEFHQSGAAADDVKSKQQELVEQFNVEKKKAQEAFLKELLPHQSKRLRQATAQIVILELTKTQQASTGILVTEMREVLNIDDVQAKRIQQKAKQLREELAEKFKKLQAQAKDELMAELSADQKSKYYEVVGDPIQ